VQLALKQKLEDLNDEISFLIDDFSDSQGPSCWFSLTENSYKKEKLAAMIPAYIGSGVKEGIASPLKQQIINFDRLLKRCAYKNKYIVTYPHQTPIDFKNAFEQLMKKQDYKITNQEKNSGTIAIKFTEKNTYAYNNHLHIINAELSVFDEFGVMKNNVKFKGKGSSFSNQKEASRKAIINLIKKIETYIKI